MAFIVLSLASRPGTKPTWSWEIIEGRSGRSLLARILEKKFISTLSSDMGL